MPAQPSLTPDLRSALAGRARDLVPVLCEQGVVGVAATWVDTSGITRVKAVPVGRLEHAAAWGVGASPVFDAFLTDDSVVAGRHAGSPVGDLRLHPDLDRLTVLDVQPGWAWAPADRYAQDGSAHPLDARLLAREAVAALAARGLVARAAFELEWALALPGEGFVPAVRGPAYGYTRLAERSDYLRDLLTALDGQGVAVEQVHPEYAAGQFEVAVGAEDPVGAADTLVLVRETVRALSLRHGLRCSFSPKMTAGGAGNGGHLHLSLWRDGRNLFGGGDGPAGLTGEAAAFTAGVLRRLPALLALGAPSPASYLRLVPQHWAGAYQAWGVENRETALRLVQGTAATGHRAANLEVKAFDLAANPYLVVAAVIHAGLAGGGELPPPVGVDPAGMTAAERAGRGIADLPHDVETSVRALEADVELTAALGAGLVETVADVRRGEVARFGPDPAAEDVVAALRWVF